MDSGTTSLSLKVKAEPSSFKYVYWSAETTPIEVAALPDLRSISGPSGLTISSADLLSLQSELPI